MRLYSDSLYYHVSLHQSDPELPYLLMLHGFMGNEHIFDHLIKELSSFCNPITIDLAGHGQTESPTDSSFSTAERQVQQLTSIIRRFQIHRLYLYGYSMGGRLAFQLLSSHPQLFSGAIIESSHCGIESEQKRIERIAIDEQRATQLEEDYSSFLNTWMEIPLFQHTPIQMRSIYKRVMKSQNPGTISASLRGFGAGVMPSVCDQLYTLTLPITLVAGELDPKYINKMTIIDQNMSTSNLIIVNNAGHRVHADQPESLINILREFMG